MIRPLIGLFFIPMAVIVAAFECIVFVIFFTFLGLEIFGVLLAITIFANGITGVLTGKDEFPLAARQGIFLVDYVICVLVAVTSFFMACGTLLALVVYVYIVLLVGTPGVYELMLFFGIPMTPLISLVALKGALVVIYFLVFVGAITSAIINRRHKP